MSNPLNVGYQPQPDMKALFQEFKQNPTKYLMGLNIPSNITTPQQMVEYCLSSGRYNIPPMLQGQINALRGMK